MSTPSEGQATPKILLGTFMPSSLIVIALVLLNAIRPEIINGAFSMLLNVTFWVALALAILSLVGLIFHFLRQMAENGFSFIERLSLCILVPSILIVVGMIILASINPDGIFRGTEINQLFWGMFALMMMSLTTFTVMRFTKRSARRKRKGKMYYY